MIKSVTVTNHIGESITLELTRPDSSGFIVKSIDGLGPSKANVNTTKIAMSDISLHNSAYLSERNIVINLGFYQTKTETIEDIRHKSYKYFPIKRNVKIRVETDTRISETEGCVESNEPDIFSSEEGCSISIICPDPFFYSPYPSEIVFYGVEPAFEFPFENSSVTLDENGTYSDSGPLLEVGNLIISTEKSVYYEGDFEVGITITIHAVGDVTDLSIYNVTNKEQININTTILTNLTGSGIIEGDTIFIETRKGNKKVTLLRNGENINILNCVDKKSKWITLSKGDNIIAYTASTGKTNLQFYISNKILYDGV